VKGIHLVSSLVTHNSFYNAYYSDSTLTKMPFEGSPPWE